MYPSEIADPRFKSPGAKVQMRCPSSTLVRRWLVTAEEAGRTDIVADVAEARSAKCFPWNPAGSVPVRNISPIRLVKLDVDDSTCFSVRRDSGNQDASFARDTRIRDDSIAEIGVPSCRFIAIDVTDREDSFPEGQGLHPRRPPPALYKCYAIKNQLKLAQ